MFPWSSSTHRGQEVRWWGRFQKKGGVQASSSRETLGILALFNQDSCPFFSLKSWDFNALLIYFKFIWKSEQDGWRREGGERKRESRGLPTAIYSLNAHKSQGWASSKPGASSSILACPMSGRIPNTWAIMCCLEECTFAGKWIRSQSGTWSQTLRYRTQESQAGL